MNSRAAFRSRRLHQGSALVAATLTLAACASAPSPFPPTAVARATLAPSPSVEVRPTPGPIPAATLAPAANVYLDAQQGPYFSRTPGTLTIGAWRTLPLAGTQALGIARATIDFGDAGPQLELTGSCSAAPGPLRVEHTFPLGSYTATVVAATLCTPTSSVDFTDVATILVLASATAAQARWPICSTFQLHMTSVDEGAGLGHAAILIRLRNVSSHGCTLIGYPRLQLVSPAGVLLPTDDHEATDGDYLFPAISPHLVALAPGGYASFLVGMSDNPSGPDEDAPYEVACPPVRWVRVALPGTHRYGTTEAAVAPCNGWVNVSSIYPGQGRITFQ